MALAGNGVDEPRIHHWYLRDNEPHFSDKTFTAADEVISNCFYRGLFEEWTNALLEGREVDDEHTKKEFIKLLERESFPEKGQIIARIRTAKEMYYLGFVSPNVRAKEATQEAGMAVSIARRLLAHEPIEQAFPAMIKASAGS